MMIEKEVVRRRAGEMRHRQEDKESISARIVQRLMSMPQYVAAETVMWYVDVRDEVRTRHALPVALADGKRVVIPYCLGKDLRLFHLHSPADLSPGAFGILEPCEELRRKDDRMVDPADVDWVAVPGVAFDVEGRRLGHGHGFYDRFLAGLSTQAVRVGVGFECQIVARVPTADHDVRMDWIVTQDRTIPCDGRGNERGGGDPGVRAGGEDC
ncbi:MAG: 5-formyltetrahydrofolate cyclo-ligase [Planctomycetales bacterium]|nr:5-formyltetrahydrofolate cyclo-ligase [Planctomycetales bacterium]